MSMKPKAGRGRLSLEEVLKIVFFTEDIDLATGGGGIAEAGIEGTAGRATNTLRTALTLGFVAFLATAGTFFGATAFLAS